MLFKTLTTSLLGLGLSATAAAGLPLIIIGAPTGEFLGGLSIGDELCSETDPDCIWNPDSHYGSTTGEPSIFNPTGEYGSSYGDYSVCNPNVDPSYTIGLYWVDGEYIRWIDTIGQNSTTELGQALYAIACL